MTTFFYKPLFVLGVNWPEIERTCFSEWSHPADAELGVQIVKDLHRTGCSLFCGEDGQENQALLKRVLLAYARWNKAVGKALFIFYNFSVKQEDSQYKRIQSLHLDNFADLIFLRTNKF